MSDTSKEKSREATRRWQEKHPDRFEASKKRQLAARKERYNNDPEYRADCIARSSARYTKKKLDINAKRRTDEFRKRRNELRQASEQEQSTMRQYNRSTERRRVLRRTLFLKKYGLTIEQYDALVVAQNGVCAICGGTTAIDKWNSGLKNLQVDHCHDTGTVRGLLCFHCNTGLGHFRDNSDLLRKAIDYLNLTSGSVQR